MSESITAVPSAWLYCNSSKMWVSSPTSGSRCSSSQKAECQRISDGRASGKRRSSKRIRARFQAVTIGYVTIGRHQASVKPNNVPASVNSKIGPKDWVVEARANKPLPLPKAPANAPAQGPAMRSART